MKNNPVVPYILILAFGIGLIFFMSVEGAGTKKELAAEKAATEQAATGGAEAGAAEGGATAGAGEALDGEALAQTCIGCHAADFTGGMGPKLAAGGASGKVDAARIEDVLVNGTGTAGSPMVAGMKTPEEAKAIAEYITTNFK